MSDIEQAVYEALGAASVCWTDEGVFDSDRAKAIGEDLMYRIVQEVEQARADERDRIAQEIEAMCPHEQDTDPTCPYMQAALIARGGESDA